MPWQGAIISDHGKLGNMDYTSFQGLRKGTIVEWEHADGSPMFRYIYLGLSDFPLWLSVGMIVYGYDWSEWHECTPSRREAGDNIALHRR